MRKKEREQTHMSSLLILELQLSDPKPTRRCIGPQYNLRRDQNRMEMKQKKKKEKHKQKKTEEVKQREVFQTASDTPPASIVFFGESPIFSQKRECKILGSALVSKSACISLVGT